MPVPEPIGVPTAVPEPIGVPTVPQPEPICVPLLLDRVTGEPIQVPKPKLAPTPKQPAVAPPASVLKKRDLAAMLDKVGVYPKELRSLAGLAGPKILRSLAGLAGPKIPRSLAGLAWLTLFSLDSAC